MYQGQFLFEGNSVYSPWFTRTADNLRVTSELVAVTGGAELTVQVWTKARETTGDGGNADATKSIVLTSAGYGTEEWFGLNELVRYKMTVGSGTNSYDYCLFRMLSPVWFSDVSA